MVTLTQDAADHVNAHIQAIGHGIGLRLGVRTTGCSGLAYQLDIVEVAEIDDTQFVSFGVTVFVDPKSLLYVDGTELDFVNDGLNEGFQFNNPNVKDKCGCGSSFNI